MVNASFLRLLLLSAIWGASFMFMRIAAPALGPSLLVFARVGIAALFLLAAARLLGKPVTFRGHTKHFLVLGLFNSALPFLLFAYAAQSVSASLLSILNSTAPIWAAALGALWLRTRVATRTMIGMALGAGGVGLLAGFESSTMTSASAPAIAAGIAAALCYGAASIYARTAPGVDPFANAHGSMWAASLLLAPLALASPLPSAVPAIHVALSVFALGVLCSGVAYLLYFRLIADIGATPALTVTYLIPVFGVLWGAVFLDERVGWHTLFGASAVLLGTALVTGLAIPARAPKGDRHVA